MKQKIAIIREIIEKTTTNIPGKSPKNYIFLGPSFMRVHLNMEQSLKEKDNLLAALKHLKPNSLSVIGVSNEYFQQDQLSVYRLFFLGDWLKIWNIIIPEEGITIRDLARLKIKSWV